MLTDREIAENKTEFIDLVYSIQREGANIDRLVKQLNKSDFFEAPASVKYHDSFRGGLCKHSLDVYRNLSTLLVTFKYADKVSEDTEKIVSLFHDISKMNLYCDEVKNKKIYCETGKKQDGMGKFDWVSVPGYAVKEPSDRFVFGNHETTSAFMISQFIPLTTEEWAVIMHHHGGMSWDSSKEDISAIFEKYPLAMYAHFADSISAYTQNDTNGEAPDERVD